MALFKDFFATRSHKNVPKVRDTAPGAGPETLPVKMNLEERMAFRRELLFETHTATLNSHFIDVGTYRFKVMRTDKRGHCYVVMLDMSPGFMSSEQGQHKQLVEIAAALKTNAQVRFGLVIGGAYWRVDDTLETTVAQWARPSAPVELAPSGNQIASNIEKYEQATAAELAEFEAAWHNEDAIQVGDRTYASDLAPLGEDPPQDR